MHKSSQSRVTMPDIKWHTQRQFPNKNPWKVLGVVCQFQGTEGVTRVLAPRLSPRKSPKRGRAAGTGALGPKRPSWMATLIGSSRKLLSDISESQASQRCVAELPWSVSRQLPLFSQKDAAMLVYRKNNSQLWS